MQGLFPPWKSNGIWIENIVKKEAEFQKPEHIMQEFYSGLYSGAVLISIFGGPSEIGSLVGNIVILRALLLGAIVGSSLVMGTIRSKAKLGNHSRSLVHVVLEINWKCLKRI